MRTTDRNFISQQGNGYETLNIFPRRQVQFCSCVCLWVGVCVCEWVCVCVCVFAGRLVYVWYIFFRNFGNNVKTFFIIGAKFYLKYFSQFNTQQNASKFHSLWIPLLLFIV